MADEAPKTEPAEQEPKKDETEEQRVPYERFQQANTKAKEAKERADALQRQFDDLKTQLEEREQQGLPELEKLKKRLEQAEQRAIEAEGKATQFEQQVTNTRKEQWVTAAAQEAKFVYPDLAAREVNLDDIESEEDAVRAVKRIAKARPKLIESDDPKLPGQVLKNGQPQKKDGEKPSPRTEEAEMLARELARFRDQWSTVSD